MIDSRMINNNVVETGLEVTKGVFVAHGNCAKGPCKRSLLVLYRLPWSNDLGYFIFNEASVLVSRLVTLPATFTINHYPRSGAED